MQQTNFYYEIIINDDCSTDGTTEILREYEVKYPDIIKPIYQTENQVSKGLHTVFSTLVFPHAKGKYIAMCEGDDYWTDPLKLQKQVDFMEAHPDHSMCFHALYNVYSDGSSVPVHRYDMDVEDCPIADVSKFRFGYVKLNTIMFDHHKVGRGPIVWCKSMCVEDGPLMLHCFAVGKVAYINELMSAYRVCSSGSWSEKMKGHVVMQHRISLAAFRVYSEFDKFTNHAYHDIVRQCRMKNIREIIIRQLRYWKHNILISRS